MLDCVSYCTAHARRPLRTKISESIFLLAEALHLRMSARQLAALTCMVSSRATVAREEGLQVPIADSSRFYLGSDSEV